MAEEQLQSTTLSVPLTETSTMSGKRTASYDSDEESLACKKRRQFGRKGGNLIASVIPDYNQVRFEILYIYIIYVLLKLYYILLNELYIFFIDISLYRM